MDLFLDFPLTTLFCLAVAAWATAAVVRRQRRRRRPAAGDGGGGICAQCGATLPAVARFCRQCGRAVTPRV